MTKTARPVYKQIQKNWQTLKYSWNNPNLMSTGWFPGELAYSTLATFVSVHHNIILKQEEIKYALFKVVTESSELVKISAEE